MIWGMLDALMAPSRISIPRINCEITCLCTHARTARNHARADAERQRERGRERERDIGKGVRGVVGGRKKFARGQGTGENGRLRDDAILLL